MELQKLYVSLLMEMKEYTAGLDDAIGQARGFGDRLKGTLGGAAQAAGLAVTGGLVAAGGAIVGLGASSVGVATEFQSSMAIMSTAVDPLSVGAQTTAEAMDILGDASLAVGSDTALVGVSASTSAEAITGLYKAGLSTSEIFGDLQGYMAGTAELSGALRASIDLAAASELDMVQASDLAAVTLATFGGHLETEAERAEFINSAMNNFVQTADASVASVGDLQAAFVNVGPTASAMGMGVEDVNTALGILSTRGITGSEAGTALKSMLVNLQRTTPDVTDTLDELGVSLYDSQGVMYELPQIIGQLQTAMAGMTDEQRQQTVVTLAGSYGMNAMNTLLGEGVEGWAAMEEAVSGAATMQESAAARTNTLAGAQEALSGVWESFQIKVGTALVPVLTQLADVGARLIEKYGPALTAIFETVGEVLGNLFDNLEEGMSPMDSFIEAIWDFAPRPVLDALVNFRDNILPGIRGAFRSVVDAVGPFVHEHGPLLLKILGGIAVAFGAFTIIMTVVGWIGGLVAAISGIGAAITAAGGGIAGLIAILGGPLTLVIGAIAGAIGLFVAAWRNDWGGIQGKVQEVIAFLQPLVQGWLSGLSEWWSATWPQLQATLQTVWGVIQSVIQSAIAVIWPAIQNFIGSLAPVWEQLKELWPTLVGLWEAAKPVLLAVLSVIGAALVTLVGLASGVINGLSQALGPLIQGIIGAVQGIIQVFTGVFETLRGLFQLIVGLFTGNTELIKEGWENLKSGISNIVGGLVSGVLSLFGGLVEGIVGFVKGLVEGVVGFFTNLFDRLVGHSIVTDLVERILALWQMLWGVVETVVRAGVEVVLGVFDAFKALFTGDFEGLKDALLGIWNTLWEAVTNVLDTLWGFFKPKFDAIWNSLKGWFDDKIEDFKQLGRDVINGIINGLDEVGDKIRQTLVDWATRAWDSVKEFFGINSPATKGKDAGKNIGEGLIEGVLESGDGFWSRTEVVFDTYYADIEDWYTSRPWEEMPEYSIDVWQEYLALLWPVTGPRYEAYYETLTEWWTTRPWESMPEYTITVFDAKFQTLNERLAPTWEDFFQTSILVFREQDWAIIGSQMVDGIVHGINSNASRIEDAMTQAALNAIRRANQILGIASPAKATIPTGEAIVNGIIAGVLNRREALAYGLETIVSDVEDILSQAGDAGGIAGGFAKRFTDSVIAPMEARLETLGGRVEAVQGLFKERMGSELVTDVSRYGDTLRQLLMLKNTLVYNDGADAAQVAMVQDAIEALRERGRLNEEYIQQQERLLALEKARADVDFLKSQLELLKLVRENGMDSSVLAGLEFGLDADAGALMDTMVDVMRRLVQSAEDELGIHSPSAWARDTMRNVMRTMAATAEQEQAGLRDSLSRALQPALSAAGAGADVGARTTDNSRRTAVYGGYHVTVQSGRDSWLEEQDELMR